MTNKSIDFFCLSFREKLGKNFSRSLACLYYLVSQFLETTFFYILKQTKRPYQKYYSFSVLIYVNKLCLYFIFKSTSPFNLLSMQFGLQGRQVWTKNLMTHGFPLPNIPCLLAILHRYFNSTVDRFLNS